MLPSLKNLVYLLFDDYPLIVSNATISTASRDAYVVVCGCGKRILKRERAMDRNGGPEMLGYA